MRSSRSPAAIASILLASTTLLGAGGPCSIRPKKGASKSELAALARISRETARRAALTSLANVPKATVKEAELEAEHGCLVYSFDIAIEGRAGVQEVQVDAGDGRVLSSKQESPKTEADEKAKDRPKSPGRH
ncbi:MAG TPA: PepSY domain-containing protein [Thermoanaerobaculia bacterium]